jgi:hypothetical protein
MCAVCGRGKIGFSPRTERILLQKSLNLYRDRYQASSWELADSETQEGICRALASRLRDLTLLQLSQLRLPSECLGPVQNLHRTSEATRNALSIPSLVVRIIL